MLSLIRLETVHPVLVHFTIGAFPVMVVAYLVATFKKSDRWMFAGDVTLVITAALTLATFSFGLVSNWVLDWPGGIDLWRWLHLSFGAFSTLLLVVFAVIRVVRRKDQKASGRFALLASIGVGGLVAFTGWIGGEVLVYQSGMAVEAAANGALAPLVPKNDVPPKGFMESMHDLRGAWAETDATIAGMVVEHPTREGFATIARDAKRIGSVAQWLSTTAPTTMKHADEPVPGGEATGMTKGQLVAHAGKELGEEANALLSAAQQSDLGAASKAAGEIEATCSGCHQKLRWRHEAAASAAR